MCESVGAAQEVQRLRSQLKGVEEQVRQAAQAGVNLLNEQVELQNRLEEQRVEMTNAMEALEQEKYSLQREGELKGRMLESLQSDYDYISNQQKQQLLQQEELLERNHNMELNELKDKVEWLRSELEESQLKEKQVKHKLEVQTETLDNKLEELRALSERTQDTMSSDMMELQMERNDLEAAKVELEHSLQEAQYRLQQLELTNSSLQRKLQRITEEKEEREKEAVSCFNALEKSREENQDLQIQLDQVLRQAQDPNSKGNSLFAELEDKRVEMERQLISVKIQYQSLKKQHAFSKQQQHHMKVQIATLMQLQSSRADPAQFERLQSMLSEKNGEIETLMAKLRSLEKVEMLLKSQPTPAKSEDGQDETYYTDLLKMKLNNSVKDSARLGDELSLQRMKSLSESQRSLELERKLFSAERALKQGQSDNIKLQLRVEELCHKYEPNEVNKNRIQKRKREKFPVDIVPPSDVTMDTKEKPVALELTSHGTAEPEADARPAAADQPEASSIKPSSPKPALQPAKTVRISEEPPVTIPNTPSSPPDVNKMKTEETERDTEGGEEENRWEEREKEGDERKRREERRKKQGTVEIIHVSSKGSLENQCSQQ